MEFTYLRVADVTMSNEVVDGQRTVGVLYGFDNSERSNAVLSAIGLTAADAHKTENGINFFASSLPVICSTTSWPLRWLPMPPP